MSAPQYDYLLKYIIIGDAAVGKSNLLLRYVNEEFKNDYQATIGVEFASKAVTLRDKIYRIQLWDTAGQETFRSITRNYYQNSACAIIVYDITCEDSFKSVNTWIEDCLNNCSKTIYMILVGNKSDLEERRVVSKEKGEELAIKYGIKFYETSAKEGINVKNVFINSIDEIAKKIDEGYYDLDDEECGIKKNLRVLKKTHKKKKKC